MVIVWARETLGNANVAAPAAVAAAAPKMNLRREGVALVLATVFAFFNSLLFFMIAPQPVIFRIQIVNYVCLMQSLTRKIPPLESFQPQFMRTFDDAGSHVNGPKIP